MKDLIALSVILLAIVIGCGFWYLVYMFTGWIGVTIIVMILMSILIFLFTSK